MFQACLSNGILTCFGMFDRWSPDMFWHVCSNTSDRQFCYVVSLFAQTFLTGGVAMF